jgi:hypothetical protein
MKGAREQAGRKQRKEDGAITGASGLVGAEDGFATIHLSASAESFDCGRRWADQATMRKTGKSESAFAALPRHRTRYMHCQQPARRRAVPVTAS